MTLEFNKLVKQVEKMGAMIEHLDFDLDERLALARSRFEAANDLAAAQERIRWVRQPDVSGYRGAAPLEIPGAERVNLTVAAPEATVPATLLAADGSQIYPDEQSPVHYYLINIGMFVYYHGSDRIPDPTTAPVLQYHQAHVHDKYGQVIRNRAVDDRRTVAEMKALAQEAWTRKRAGENNPRIALYDNRLLYLPGNDSNDGSGLLQEYFAALVQLHDAEATLAGYIDNPFRSKRFIQLLYLLSLETEEEVKMNQRILSRAGDLDGLRDQQFFQLVLKPGERSAILVQNSPQNFTFKERGENYEIAFFYLKVSNQHQARVVRVDIPMWVARDRQQVDQLHSLILSQCQLQGRNPYPYALTRADELAYVSGKERDKLDQLVKVQIRKIKESMTLQDISAKSRGKELARGDQRYFEIRGQRDIDYD